MTPSSATAARLRVLTFNILTGHDLTGRLDLGRTADVIAAAEPDVVALQEVDRHFAERSEYADQTVELAERLGGWHHGFAPALDLDPEPGRTHHRQFGDAVLTPHRLVEFTPHLLTNLPTDDPDTETRAASVAVVEIGGRRLRVVHTHLEHQSAEQRGHQATQVHALATAAAGPTVLLGDLNAGSDEPEVATISKGFHDATADLDPASALTWPSDVPERRLDHIFVRDLRPLRSAVLDVRASDHRPVLAELSWD